MLRTTVTLAAFFALRPVKCERDCLSVLGFYCSWREQEGNMNATLYYLTATPSPPSPPATATQQKRIVPRTRARACKTHKHANTDKHAHKHAQHTHSHHTHLLAPCGAASASASGGDRAAPGREAEVGLWPAPRSQSPTVLRVSLAFSSSISLFQKPTTASPAPPGTSGVLWCGAVCAYVFVCALACEFLSLYTYLCV